MMIFEELLFYPIVRPSPNRPTLESLTGLDAMVFLRRRGFPRPAGNELLVPTLQQRTGSGDSTSKKGFTFLLPRTLMARNIS